MICVELENRWRVSSENWSEGRPSDCSESRPKEYDRERLSWIGAIHGTDPLIDFKPPDW